MRRLLTFCTAAFFLAGFAFSLVLATMAELFAPAPLSFRADQTPPSIFETRRLGLI